jgi:ectoine hydroxylase-related dioxygenase (phytanoyl-CoA dioxygenase family)
MDSTLALPTLDNDYDLASDQITAYQRDGHICLRAVCSPEETAAYRPIIADAVGRYNEERRELAERDAYGKAFLQTMNLWTRDEACKRFAMAQRFAKVAADLMGVDGVRIYHDQALFKEAGGGQTPWHQDQHYWPLDTSHTITMWMALMPMDEAMGVMSFSSGSHTEGYFGDIDLWDESETRLRELAYSKGTGITSPGAMAPGDATFHNGWCLHHAPANESGQVREVMTVIYYADGTRVMEPDNKERAEDLKRWIPGGVPGEKAASPINPVLYRRE